MWPVLFRIPFPGWDLPLVGKVDSIPIYSYGVMLGLSLVVGWYLTLGLAEKDGLPRETMANNYVITAVAAVVAARLLYVLTNLGEFESLADVFSFNRGGLVAYGGFLGGFAGSWGYLKLKKIRLLPWADVAVPSLASGLAITRVGCFLFGCDFGKPLAEDAPAWLKTAGTFPRWEEGLLPTAGSPAWLQHVNTGRLEATATASLPVHPTQLYESLLGISLLLLLLWVRKRQRFRGQIFFVFTLAYGAARFMLEILRDDAERGNVPGSLPEHIFLPLCLIAFAVAYWLSVSLVVENKAIRTATRLLAFVPAVVAFVMLRPASFAAATLMQLSTSQFIGLASGLAVAAAYVVYDRAAEAHPAAAMDLGLPDDLDEDTDADADDDDADADADGDDADDAEAKSAKGKRDDGDGETSAKKRRPKGRKRKARKPSRDEDDSADGDSAADEVADAADDDESEDADAFEDADADADVDADADADDDTDEGDDDEQAGAGKSVEVPVRGDSDPAPASGPLDQPGDEIEIGQTSDAEEKPAAKPKPAARRATKNKTTRKRRPKKRRRK